MLLAVISVINLNNGNNDFSLHQHCQSGTLQSKVTKRMGTCN